MKSEEEEQVERLTKLLTRASISLERGVVTIKPNEEFAGDKAAVRLFVELGMYLSDGNKKLDGE